MPTSSRPNLPAMLVALMLVGFSLQGCIATTVAGATVGLATKVTSFAVGTTFKVAGAALHIGKHTAKKPAAASR
ncbi:MAG TPA: hypothetical protein VHW60_17820 [Caulobacteraceae bacterium]|jgi:hypothetical protein|nr:hypothetical protein [Caulobacteraceae bacterium]